MTALTETTGTENPNAQDPTNSATKGLATQDQLEDDNEPHAVRTTLARQGRTPGVNLTTAHGTVFVPCWALPDLRRRLLVAQGRLATVAPAPSTRGRRRGPQNGS